MIKDNKYITTKEIANNLDISERHVLRLIESLKNNNYIQRVGSNKTGYWEVMKY